MNIITLKNSIVQITYWICNMCVAAFTTGYLTKFGFHEWHIGFIMSVSAIITIIINFYIDDAMDQLVFYHLKKTIIANYILCCLFTILFLFIGKPNGLTLLLFASICSFTTHNQRLINILCERQKHQHFLTDGNRPANYGLLGYGIATLLMGYRISLTQVDIILPAFLFFSCIAIVLTQLLLKDEVEPQREIDVTVQYQNAFQLLRKNHLFSLFIIASCLSSVGSMAAIKFLVRVVNQLQGNAFHHSIALTIQTLITIPISLQSKKMIRKFSVNRLLLVSFTFSFLKILLLLLAHNLVTVYLSMACSIFGYGLFGFSSAAFTKQLNEPEHHLLAHKIALFASSFGLGPLLGGILAGCCMELAGLKTLLLICSVLTFLPCIIQGYLLFKTSCQKK